MPGPAKESARRHRRLLGLVVVVVVAVGAWLTYQWAVDPAEPGSFYSPPDDIPSGRPGTIVREEDVGVASPGGPVQRVLYTSADGTGKPIVASAIVASPSGRPPAGGWSVVAWAHGTTGVASRCAPSLDRDAGLGKVPELARLLAAGNVVVIPDYPGLGTPGPHPYLVGQSEGRSVLDSIRAARSLLPDETNTDSVVFGHSQGGHAVVFAAALAPTYAPEIHLLGAAAMAPPTDLGRLVLLDEAEPPGIVLTAMAVRSWSALYRDTTEASVVLPEARPIVDRLAARCVETSGQGISDLPDVLALKAGFLSRDPSTAPGWAERLKANSPGPGAIGTPMLVAQGLADTLVRPPVTLAFVRDQCAAGARIELLTYAAVGHFQVRTAAAADVVGWMLARLDDTPPAGGCVTRETP